MHVWYFCRLRCWSEAYHQLINLKAKLIIWWSKVGAYQVITLNKQHVSLGVFDKCCLLTNFLQENGQWWYNEVEQLQLCLQYWDKQTNHSRSAKSWYEEDTGQDMFDIRSHRGQGWLDTHILLELLLSYMSLIHIWTWRRYSLCRSRWSPYH